MSNIELFTSPNESSIVVAALKSGDEIFPLADTLAGESARRYLVRPRQVQSGESNRALLTSQKNLKSFLRALPGEPSLSVTLAPHH
jgi:hypothetical protein